MAMMNASEDLDGFKSSDIDGFKYDESDRNTKFEVPFCGCLSVQYYRPYFNVDTEDVFNRILNAVSYCRRDQTFLSLVDDRPDAYGPFWIATTLVFTVAVASHINRWITSWMDGSVWYVLFILIFSLLLSTFINCYLQGIQFSNGVNGILGNLFIRGYCSSGHMGSVQAIRQELEVHHNLVPLRLLPDFLHTRDCTFKFPTFTLSIILPLLPLLYLSDMI